MQHYSDELKAKILTELKEKQSVTTLSKQYIISRNTIYRWLKETEIAEKYSSDIALSCVHPEPAGRLSSSAQRLGGSPEALRRDDR